MSKSVEARKNLDTTGCTQGLPVSWDAGGGPEEAQELDNQELQPVLALRAPWTGSACLHGRATSTNEEQE